MRRGTVGSRAENVNVPSSLLEEHENREVFNLIGKRCFVSLCKEYQEMQIKGIKYLIKI